MGHDSGSGSDSMSIVKSGPGLPPPVEQIELGELVAATEEERLEKKESREDEESR